ncbi:MAG: FKBP-type peptidyl-prolyl cis-trans isomerase [Chitinophagaceae bacterium]|nr:FKBP-type peptidyl-prolyl cis-trans isomerase [Chitinophagaceae bacterium]
MPYKIIPGKDTQWVKAGNVMKLSVLQKYNDSIIYSNLNGLPNYVFVSGEVRQPYDFSELWLKVRKGDSLVVSQSVDTFIKRVPELVPPYFRKGGILITEFKILDILKNDSAAKADEARTRENFLRQEIKEIETYLAQQKIQAEKTPSGAFYQILKQGDGPKADSGNFVSVNYNGYDWSGKKFDSNTDPAFGHVQPFSFTAGVGDMIKGFDEAVLTMKKGGKVKVFIPSLLGYGPAGSPPKIKPYEKLIFEIELTDVKPKAPIVMPPPPPPLPQKIDSSQRRGN